MLHNVTMGVDFDFVRRVLKDLVHGCVARSFCPQRYFVYVKILL